jgi:hypothetical protein
VSRKYVRKNASAIARLYVHQMTSTDGLTYTCGAAKEATSQPATANVVGGHFFKPCEDNLLVLSTPGFARIAYQVEQGSSELMLDCTPVAFAQELLTTAFPLYAATLPSSNNVDFYGAGMNGTRTAKYIEAFSSLGVTLMFRRFEPLATAEMGDRSSYAAPTETPYKVVIDPSSYSFPTPELQIADQTAWIERDVRRLFLPPNVPLLRTFLLNAGNIVWTILLDGNEYEVSQVVPRFIDEEIVFYEANAYVIGPSRDPWSRVILPSET